MKKNAPTMYAITEQGDLGLGLDVLSESEQKMVSPKEEDEKKKKSSYKYNY